MERNWYVQHNGHVVGPLSSEQLKHLASTKQITSETKVRLGDTGDWIAASNVKGLFPGNSISRKASASPSVPPKLPPNSEKSHPVPSQRIECPFCAEPIAHNAKKCKHCGEFLDPVLRATANQHAAAAPQIFMNVAGGSAHASAEAKASVKQSTEGFEVLSGCVGCLVIIVIIAFLSAVMGAVWAAA